ncbi:MAG: hypothetical protein JWM04_707 [Verrucomicrobiales bacterium]|nr:hypothetical protein [Verrucomicrobiales bacterium]
MLLWLWIAGMTCFGVEVTSSQNAGTIPVASDSGILYSNLSVRVACWLGWSDEIIKEKPFSGDRGPDGGWRYFDVKFSLKGLPKKQTAAEFLDLVSKRTGYVYSNPSFGWLTILRWSEKAGKFLRVGKPIRLSKNDPMATTFEEGDFLVFYRMVD